MKSIHSEYQKALDYAKAQARLARDYYMEMDYTHELSDLVSFQMSLNDSMLDLIESLMGDLSVLRAERDVAEMGRALSDG